jgi:hypothetical protein
VGYLVVCLVAGVPSSLVCYINLCSSLNSSNFLWCNPPSIVEDCLCSEKRCLCLLLMMILRIRLMVSGFFHTFLLVEVMHGLNFCPRLNSSR